MSKRIHLMCSILACLVVLASPAVSQDVDSNMWLTDGIVNAVVRSGNTVYIGGSFTYVGPATGNGSALDRTTGSLLPYSKVNGVIWTVAPDGSGGWYIGGTFSEVGGESRQNLAHVLADGTLSPWNPGANYGVSSLVVSGSMVYAGGGFNSIGGQPRRCIAALDLSTGQATF